MLLSVIILNWNTRDLTLRCMRSVKEYLNVAPYEVIVVDNGSTDGSVEALREAFPEVTVVANGANLGFARGNNLGARQARGRYLLFLNSDMEFTRYTDLCYMIEKLHEPHVGLVAPQLLNPDGSVQRSVRGFPTPCGILFHYTNLSRRFPGHPFFNRYLKLDWDHDEEAYVEQPMGAFFLLERDYFFSLGGFNEDYFIFYEDVHLCHQIARRGDRVLFTNRSRAIHLGSSSTALVPGRYFYQCNRNLIRYYRHFHSPLETVVLKAALLVGVAYQFLASLRHASQPGSRALAGEAARFLLRMWFM